MSSDCESKVQLPLVEDLLFKGPFLTNCVSAIFSLLNFPFDCPVEDFVGNKLKSHLSKLNDAVPTSSSVPALCPVPNCLCSAVKLASRIRRSIDEGVLRDLSGNVFEQERGLYGFGSSAEVVALLVRCRGYLSDFEFDSVDYLECVYDCVHGIVPNSEAND